MVADEFCRQLLSVFKLSTLNAHVLAQTHIFRCTEPKEKIIMPVRSSGTHHPLNKHQDKNERNCVFNPFHLRERINFLRTIFLVEKNVDLVPYLLINKSKVEIHIRIFLAASANCVHC